MLKLLVPKDIYIIIILIYSVVYNNFKIAVLILLLIIRQLSAFRVFLEKRTEKTLF